MATGEFQLIPFPLSKSKKKSSRSPATMKRRGSQESIQSRQNGSISSGTIVNNGAPKKTRRTKIAIYKYE
ncbi:hypothetical protein [Saccharococcus caldoxylosilyticus]|uniref:hypothetical protein n=1 Tax=Saccharococcus caldoxylosilyticus TaxID=81408 RepID=UPI0012FDD943